MGKEVAMDVKNHRRPVAKIPITRRRVLPSLSTKFSAKKRKGTSEKAINENANPAEETLKPLPLVKTGRKVDPKAPIVMDATPASTSR